MIKGAEGRGMWIRSLKSFRGIQIEHEGMMVYGARICFLVGMVKVWFI